MNIDSSIEINEKLEYANKEYGEPVLIEGVNCKNVVFKNCVFKNTVAFKKVNSQIKFQDCQFEGGVDVFGIYKNISFLYCDFTRKIKFKSLKAINIEFLECKIDEIIISESLDLEKLNLYNSRVSICSFDRSSVNNLILKSTRVEVLDIKSSGDCYLDFGGSSISEIHLSTKLKNKIAKGKFKKVFKGNNHYFWSDVSSSLLSIHNSYENKRRYKDADLIYVQMKYADFRASLQNSSNIFKKGFIILYYLINRFLFGWGVKISNISIFSLSVISLYAFLYFNNKNIENYMSNDSLNDKIYSAFYVSVARFFNFGEFAYEYKFFQYFDIQESLVGFLLLTLLTAFLVRKFVR